MKTLERLQVEHDFLSRLSACEQQALSAMQKADWQALVQTATDLDALAGHINQAMAVGFHSEEVASQLQRLLGLYQQALLQAQGADQALRQQEEDLLQQRSELAEVDSNEVNDPANNPSVDDGSRE